MALIICIETSTTVCSVALSRNGKLQALREIETGYVHAEKLLPFISEIILDAGISKQEIQAIAVSAGPGSYTGLRIGISAAKGLCYALDIPLISISSLKSLAWKAREAIPEHEQSSVVLFCPMIDARRMEVYNALYDEELKEIRGVMAEVIIADSLTDYLKEYQVYFTGDGAEKCKAVFSGNKNARFELESNASASSMCALVESKFQSGQFEDLALFEPFYLKEYRAGVSNSKSKD